jgi:TetR/AcrR family transcriptional regulator, transcriptional repressor for nem operon
MARRSRAAAAQSKARVVEEAAKLFRLNGYEGTSLDDVMRAADLTVGTFYAHFASKADLFRNILERGNAESYERLMPASSRAATGEEWLARFLFHYLSEQHRDGAESGCYFPILAADVARSGTDTKQVFEAVLRAMVRRRASEMGTTRSRRDGEDQILSLFCMAVGALSLSRAVASSAFSNQILRAARKATNRKNVAHNEVARKATARNA